MNFANVGSGSFNVVISWAGKTKSCSISYNIVAKPENCGNGFINEGETCISCPADAGCDFSAGQVCDTNPFSPTVAMCITPSVPPVIPPSDGGFDFFTIGIIIALIIGFSGVVLVLKGRGVF